jgi:hypothetical protein
LEDWRRALMRARAEERNAPAEPMTARMAVGFSGEWSQPPCAWSGRATASRRAKLKNFRADFFMDGLRVGRYRHSGKAWVQKAICQCENAVSVVPFWAAKRKDCDLVHSGDFLLRWICVLDTSRGSVFFAGRIEFAGSERKCSEAGRHTQGLKRKAALRAKYFRRG